jgi:KUP system potassium uptake protein
MFHSELVQGIPPIFKHYMTNVPALHSVLVFVSIKSLPISKVLEEERFLFRRIEPRGLYIFRCVARYGYTDLRTEEEPFERKLVEKLKEFIKEEILSTSVNLMTNGTGEHVEEEIVVDNQNQTKQFGEDHDHQQKRSEELEREIDAVENAWHAGVVHLIGENEVIANKESGIAKRILIDYVYGFLKRNLGQSDKVFDIPHKRMLKVGMTYEL